MARLRSRNQPRVGEPKAIDVSPRSLSWQRQSPLALSVHFLSTCKQRHVTHKRARVAPPPQLNNPHDSLALGGRHIDTSPSRSTHTLSRSLTDNITRLSAPLFRSLSRHHARSRTLSRSRLSHILHALTRSSLLWGLPTTALPHLNHTFRYSRQPSRSHEKRGPLTHTALQSPTHRRPHHIRLFAWMSRRPSILLLPLLLRTRHLVRAPSSPIEIIQVSVRHEKGPPRPLPRRTPPERHHL